MQHVSRYILNILHTCCFTLSHLQLYIYIGIHYALEIQLILHAYITYLNGLDSSFHMSNDEVLICYPSNLSPAGQELRSPPRRPRRRPRPSAKQRQRRKLCLVPWSRKEPRHWTSWKLKFATCLIAFTNPKLCVDGVGWYIVCYFPNFPKCNVVSSTVPMIIKTRFTGSPCEQLRLIFFVDRQYHRALDEWAPFLWNLPGANWLKLPTL